MRIGNFRKNFITETKKVLGGKSENAAWELLSDMTKRGFLMRVRQGLYYIIPFEQDPATFMPDWHLLAECLARDTNYYIGYYSALQLHNLTTQPALNELVVTDRQIRPATKSSGRNRRCYLSLHV